jgi:hypothetical protein
VGNHLLIHAFILSPVKEPIVAVATLEGIDDGQFGLRARLPIPSIMNGEAALSSFSFSTVTRRDGKGRRYGYARARCPAPEGFSAVNGLIARLGIYAAKSDEPLLQSDRPVSVCSVDRISAG